MALVNEGAVTALNELVRINNDRIEGYMRASNETNDSDLRVLFNEMAQQSQQYRGELSMLISGMGGDVADGTTISGKFYRVWMDVKSMLTSNDRRTALENCEFGEDAALEAYQTALESDADFSSDARQLISRQHQGIRQSHDRIRQMRDAAQAL